MRDNRAASETEKSSLKMLEDTEDFRVKETKEGKFTKDMEEEHR